MMTMTRSLCTTLLSLAISVPAVAQTAATGTAASGTAAAQSRTSSWLDHVDFFIGLDGSKQPQDLGINANMGPRFSVNAGVPLARRGGFGAQAGVAVNFSDAAVHVLDQVEGTSRRTQVFMSGGVFQRLQRVSWGMAFDAVHQRYYDDVWMSQWRGEFAYAVGQRDELGMWFTVPMRKADAAIATTPVRLEPIAQFNGFARHDWPSGARTSLWVGMARGHHNVVLVFDDNSKSHNVLVYGAEVSMPLNERWSLTGATNLITPTSTGTVDAYMGATFNFGGRRNPRSGFAPLQSVANNTSFSVDLSRK